MKSCSAGGTRSTTIKTPNRKRAISALANKNYRSAASKFDSLSGARDCILKNVTKRIRSEIKSICSLRHNSILRGSHEQLKQYSWQSVWQELKDHVPTLSNLMQLLMPKSDQKFISFLICAILKKSCKHMSLVQRVFSFVLYSNAANKQVSCYKFQSLQLCMVCMFIVVQALSPIHDMHGSIYHHKDC